MTNKFSLICAFVSMLLVLFLCFEHTLSCRSQAEIDSLNDTRTKNNFGNSSTWGGWDPPENDSSWKYWIILYGSKNSINDSSETGQESEPGWPQHWGNLGKPNEGVPPPPWAILPLAYGKPQFCFLQPARGECDKNLIRWGYNPTTNDCQTFQYSGCGGNENNFRDKETCKKSCIDNSSTGCESQAKINFEEMIYD